MKAAMKTHLTKIDIGNSGDSASASHVKSAISEDIHTHSSGFSHGDQTTWHPVTLLYQMCLNLHWPAPIYECINEEITTEKHIFTMECKVLQFKATGAGWSKKKAKCVASKALFEMIKDNHLEKVSSVPHHQVHNYNEMKTMCSSDDEISVNATDELHKMCDIRRWPSPEYKLLSVEGPSHNLVYRVGCLVPGLTELVEGKGYSKKEAKHTASLATLIEIADVVSSSSSSPLTRNFLPKQKNESGFLENLLSSENATSLLYEMCTFCKWPKPEYEVLHEEYYERNRFFTIKCSLLDLSELGIGYTKKEAKHAASSALLLKVKEPLHLFLYNSFTTRKKVVVDTNKNATTLLHEKCTSLNMPKPTYKVLMLKDLPDCKKEFIIECSVLGCPILAEGSGSNKKEAKHAASQSLLENIQCNRNCGSPLH